MSKKQLVLGLALVGLLGISCCGQKEVATEEAKVASESKKEIVMDNTYLSGVISQTKQEGDCQWLITLDDGRVFETTNMDKKYMKNNARVNFKFRGLRRMSKCNNALPVEITEMNMDM